MKALLIVYFFCLVLFEAGAQNVFRDLKSLEVRADRHVQEMSYMTAIDLYQQMLLKKKYEENAAVRVKIARACARIGQTEEAESYFREALAKGLRPAQADSSWFARVLISNHNYTEAQRWLKNQATQQSDPVLLAQYESITKLHQLYKDSFSFTARPVAYNSEYADYCPVFYKNGIVFSSDRPVEKFIKQVNMQKAAGFSELYFVKERDTTDEAVRNFPLDDFKTPFHKGPVLFYDNGNKMILTANAGKAHSNRLQMFMAEWDRKKMEWTNVRPFPYNSEFYSVGHPALSKDERTLYYVSDMPGGSGGTDLYVSFLKDGEWSVPKNLREPINTEGDEMFPYISPSGKFYFSSDGHGGLGGLDFFFVENAHDHRQIVYNPGYPLNSAGDDFGIILDAQERSGYFSSNRKGGKGSDDLYRLYIKQIELRLKVTDEIASASLSDPQIRLIEQETGTEISPLRGYQPKDNLVSYVLKPQHEYKLTIHKDDYKDVEKEISTMGISDDRMLEMKAVLKRKFEYYVSLKVRDAETENIATNSAIHLINLTALQWDSIGRNGSGEADIKLDSEADYLLIAYDGNRYGQVLVEKPGKKKVSSVRYITLRLTEPVVKKHRWVLLDSLDNPGAGKEMIVRNMITGEEQTIISTETGRVEFSIRGDWYYRLYYEDRNYFYDSLTRKNNGTLILKQE